MLAGKTVTAISAGFAHTCAIADGNAYCWGSGADGVLGNGGTADSSVPVAVGGALSGKTVTAISAGRSNTCAVAAGRAYCWGYNLNGQLGNGATTDSATPVAVNAPASWPAGPSPQSRSARSPRPPPVPSPIPRLLLGRATPPAPSATAPPPPAHPRCGSNWGARRSGRHR